MGALESATDSLLAQRAADGDELAFAVIVRRHAPFLRAFVIRLTGSSVDADDAVQDALITAWQRMSELTEPAKLRSWLTTIASRKATDRARSRHQESSIDELIEAPRALDEGPDARAETSSQLDALGAVLGGLPQELREVWVLKEMGGLSYDEIAERLEISASTVRGRLARARAAVLDQMQDWR